MEKKMCRGKFPGILTVQMCQIPLNCLNSWLVKHDPLSVTRTSGIRGWRISYEDVGL